MALILGNNVYDGYSQGAGDLNWGGGYAMLLGPWIKDNVASSETNVALGLLGNIDGYAPRVSRLAVRSGSVLGIAVRSNAARTAGTLTAEVTINGVGTGLTVALNAVDTTVNTSNQLKDLDTFLPGAEIGVRLTTSAWTPETADISVEVLVEQ